MRPEAIDAMSPQLVRTQHFEQDFWRNMQTWSDLMAKEARKQMRRESEQPVPHNIYEYVQPVKRLVRCLRRRLRGFGYFTPAEPPFTRADVETYLENNIYSSLRKISKAEFAGESQVKNGGMGLVNKSEWEYEASPVAIKSISIRTWEKAKQFVSELNRLHECAAHAGFPRVKGWMCEWELGADNSLVGKIIMEYFDFDLRTYLDLVKQGSLPPPSWKQRVMLLRNYAHALDYLHSVARLIHADIHPGNLMIRMQTQSLGVGYLIDLGLSKSIDNQSYEVNLSTWTAPDVGDTGHTINSDIFSFGMAMLSLANLEIAFIPRPDTHLAKNNPRIAILIEFLRTGEINVEIPDSFDDFPGVGLDTKFLGLICMCLHANHSERGSMKQICLQLDGLIKEIEELEQKAMPTENLPVHNH